MRNRLFPLLLTLLLISCTTARESTSIEEGATLHDEINELIAGMPAEEPAEQSWFNEQLLETGPAGIRVLAGMLVPPGSGDDTQARYALSSLAVHVSRPGAESERAAFERALLEELRRGHSADAKTFLMNQLEQAGSNRSVAVLERFLIDGRLYKPAINVLFTLQTPEAVRALRSALPAAEGARRIALIKTLGDLQDEGAVETIRPFVSAEDRPTRRMALYALANIGSPSVNDLFLQAPESDEPLRNREIVSFTLTYAGRLAQKGHHSMSAEISRRLLVGEYPAHVHSSALAILFQIEGREMLDELLETAIHADSKLAASALSKVNSLDGREITKKILSALEEASESRRALLLEALGNRGDQSAAPALKPFLRASSSQIRVAASQALVSLKGEESLSEILEVLNLAEAESEIESLESVLLQIPTQELIPATAEMLQTASGSARPALIRILANRKASGYGDVMAELADSENDAVRMEVYHYFRQLGSPEDFSGLMNQLSESQSEGEIAAIQDALAGIVGRQTEAAVRDEILLRAWSEAPDVQKSRLLEVFPQTEGVETLSVVREALNHSDNSIRDAAVTALAKWPDPLALPDLLKAASIAADSLLPDVYAGYMRLVNRSGYPLEEKEKMLHDLVQTTDSNRQKARILSHLSSLDELLSLQTASRYFDFENEAVRDSALKAASGVLASHYDPVEDTLNPSSAVLAVLEPSARHMLREKLEQQVKKSTEKNEAPSGGSKAMKEQELPEPAFGRIFNGRDLDGWEVIGGNPDSWGVEDGLLYTDGEGSGWISTVSRYDNFILELEYRVPEGGNSGVFLRAPHEGNPAYEGMEIQVLDDYADQYSELQPWQYTGSIYGVKAPSKRATKPAGEWQSLKIKADGPDIRVMVNGERVIHTSLIRHMELADSHPGLVRRAGFIGLQNHGDRVEFRNIVIHRIK